MTINAQDNNSQPISFIKEVAKYFMNFLETDFKKRRIPKRNSIQKTFKSLKVGIDLEKYPSLKLKMNQFLNDGFKRESIKIKKGDFVNSLPANLFNLISQKVDDIEDKQLEECFKLIKNTIEEKNILYPKEYDKYLEDSKESIKMVFSKQLILPLLDTLEKPLENLEVTDENGKFQLEVEITDSLFTLFEEKLSELLQSYFHNPINTQIIKGLELFISLNEIKEIFNKFFENYAINDAFYDIYQVYRNNSLLDKTELYLYFYELSLGNEKFPLFYIPVTVVKEDFEFIFVFDRRLFVNTKAIDFVVQEYNAQVTKKSTLAAEIDRIIYLNENIPFPDTIEKIIRKIENFFELNRNIQLNDSNLQKGVNLIASLKNTHYIFLFDKSDESLINDYEEILNDNGDLSSSFATLLIDFVEKNPKSYIDEVDDEWDEQDIPSKLVVESPIPLNDEQKQVLLALQKPECKYIILEGPPGTGKSHTITSIICKALLEEKSVLVLSDKKEALDVVEDKITETLNKVRHGRKEEEFQNPILRLGKAGNKFYKIVQGQSIQKIKEHYQAFKHKYSEYINEKEQAISLQKESISNNIKYIESISLDEIIFYFNNYNKFFQTGWFNLTEEIPEKIYEQLIELKDITTLLKKYQDCHYKLKDIDKNKLSSLDNLVDQLNQLEETKLQLQKIKVNIAEINTALSKIFTLPSEERNKLRQDFVKIQSYYELLKNVAKDSKVPILQSIDKVVSLKELNDALKLLLKTLSLVHKAEKYIGENRAIMENISHFIVANDHDFVNSIELFENYILEVKKLRKPLIGFLLSGEAVHQLNRKLKRCFYSMNLEHPENNLSILQDISELYRFIYENLNKDDSLQILPQDVIKILQLDDNKIETKLLQSAITNIEQQSTYESLKVTELNYLILFTDLVTYGSQVKRSIEELNTLNLDIKITDEILFSGPLDRVIKYVQTQKMHISELLELEDKINFLTLFQKDNPFICSKLNLMVNHEVISSFNCVLQDYTENYIAEYIKYSLIGNKLVKQFNNEPPDFFSDLKKDVEKLITAEMAFNLDKRIIEYTNNYPADVTLLRSIISKKQQFPKNLFANLKKAFPCILAGIRDYAEYIPLEKDLFDLIIIDEASQVSIAQSLPALIRGRQVIVLGDDKQFSNVKSTNASSITNQQYKSRIEQVFIAERIHGEDKNGLLTKIKSNFDIKNSILKFLRSVRNYECQLKKHFRCYPEVISYSDKYFYDYTLQCMKIRGKPIEEVIKFEFIEHDGKFDESKNTNELEVKFILDQLKKFHQDNVLQSIGIISPHREQVTLLIDKINEIPEKDWLYEKCKLKIMTFDTCQGEERDYIFYTMVATKEKDRLTWIFLKDFKTLNEEIDGTVKSQRLNVGFSRAKECIHFVLSKPLEEFTGEIKNALFHYKNELETAKGKIIGDTDPLSPMETKIKNYIVETKFYKERKEKIEVMTQFAVGDYLKQLDSNYNHPAYKVDFLIVLDKMEKIILEYDGFKEHFTDLDEVNVSNYKYYMKEDDVYRQKVLESYGYKFLRINKFNLGEDPVTTLNSRLENLVKKNLKTYLH